MPQTPIPTSIAVRNFFPLPPKKYEQDGAHENGAQRSTAVDEPTTQNSHYYDVGLHTYQIEKLTRTSRASSFMARSEHVLTDNHLRLDVVLQSENETKTICTLSASQSIHPHWNHLNEQIINKHNEEEWEKMYPNLHARFIIQTNSSTSSSTLSSERILTQIPLHPTQLRIIPSTSAYTETINTPNSLPPNAILIHYDDGVTRVLPSLWELLVRRRVIEEVDTSTLQMGSVEGERFDDRVFDVLGDSVDEKKDGKENAKHGSIYDDKVFDLLGEPKATDKDNTSNLDEPEERQYMNSGNGVNGANGALKHKAATPLTPSLPTVTSAQFLKEQQSKDLLRIKNEVLQLRQLVKHEQQLLEREQMMMRQVSKVGRCVSFYALLSLSFCKSMNYTL